MRSRSGTFETTIEINGVEDVPILVGYTFYPFSAGSTDGRYGPKIEPDEPAHVEIDDIEVKNDDEYIRQMGKKRIVELTDAERERIEIEIGEFLADQEADYRECERDY